MIGLQGWLLGSILTVSFLTLASAGGPNSRARQVAGAGRIQIDRPSRLIGPGETETFVASVSGLPNGAVNWSCSEGSIGSSGKYVAPMTSGIYEVTAESVSDPNLSSEIEVVVTQNGKFIPHPVVHFGMASRPISGRQIVDARAAMVPAMHHPPFMDLR